MVCEHPHTEGHKCTGSSVFYRGVPSQFGRPGPRDPIWSLTSAVAYHKLVNERNCGERVGPIAIPQTSNFTAINRHTLPPMFRVCGENFGIVMRVQHSEHVSATTRYFEILLISVIRRQAHIFFDRKASCLFVCCRQFIPTCSLQVATLRTRFTIIRQFSRLTTANTTSEFSLLLALRPSYRGTGSGSETDEPQHCSITRSVGEQQHT